MQQQSQEHLTNVNLLPGILNNTRNGFKNQDTLSNETETSQNSLHYKLKQTSKRRLDDSPHADDSPDEDAMDVEPSPAVIADPTAGQSSSGLFSVVDTYNKDFRIHLSTPKMDTMINNKTPSSSLSSSSIIPTQKKRLKPNLSVLDEIFF